MSAVQQKLFFFLLFFISHQHDNVLFESLKFDLDSLLFMLAACVKGKNEISKQELKTGV